MPRFRSLAAGLLVFALVGATVQLGMWWVVEAVSSPDVMDPPGPRLQLVTDVQDLGRIAAGEQLLAKFVIANTGNDGLVFRPVRGACCKEQPPEPLTTVSPGQTAEIEVPVAWRELGSHGQQRFHFLTNDRQQPEFWLTVRGTVGPAAREEHSVLVRRQ